MYYIDSNDIPGPGKQMLTCDTIVSLVNIYIYIFLFILF